MLGPYLLGLPKAVGLCSPRFRHFLGVDEVSGTPIALYKPPGPGHIHGVPGVTETVVLELDTRLVPRRLAVTLDHYAMQPSVTKNYKETIKLKGYYPCYKKHLNMRHNVNSFVSDCHYGFGLGSDLKKSKSL